MKKLYFLNVFLFISMVSVAQLDVTTDISNETLTDWIEGTDVLVTNLVVDCDSAAYGTFLNSTIDDGLEVVEGIVFATAPAMSAVDNTSGAITNPGASDMDLEQSIGFPVYDVCRVEFDVQPLYEFLIFNYVFASDEYPEWVGTGFNDVFGFFVSGPGIEGSFSDGAKNFSNVPGTDLPVSINSVNAAMNEEYYIDNESGIAAICTYDPNPTSDFLNLRGEDLNDMTSYEITSVDGKTVQRGSVQKDNLQIDITVLASGSYLLNLIQNDQVASVIQWTKN